MRTLQHNLGHDTFWVLDKRVYSVNRIIIARVFTLRDLHILAFRLGYALCEPVRVVRMLFNLSIT